MNQNKLDLAEKSLLEGIESLKIMPFVDVEVEKNFYENLKDIANRKGDYAQYFQYDQKYTSALKKADKIALEKTIQNAIAKYDLNTKEEKIKLLTAQNNLKSGLIIAVVALIILGIIAFFYFYKSIKIKQKYLEQKKIKLQQEKEQTQKELMNSVLHLEKKNEILNELKEKLLEQNKDNHSTIHNSIFKTIDAGLVVDDDFEKFKNNFNSIYPEFFEKLQQKANQTLTQLDLKYCGFILMKVTNKEMAMQMNVEPKSIRMARYRIKQKLQLSKEDDMDHFIHHAIL
jgi:DNA-binding CsgD family transcriptional regulator